MDTDNQICNKCGENKPVSEFSIHSNYKKRRNCKDCRKKVAKIRYEEKKPELFKQLYRRNSVLRAEALQKYGGRCACCGEDEQRFLSIDHINNDGNEHRKIMTMNIQRWLKKNNYPKDFQVLCYNCNLGKQHNKGICPHKQ